MFNLFFTSLPRYTSKLLLAGDHLQLPPTVLSTAPRVKTALSRSLMERMVGIVGKPVIQLLETQYRMNETIMNWPSATFYKRELKAAPSVAERKLTDLPGVAVSSTTDRELLLVDTRGAMKEQSSKDPRKSSIANPGEAGVVVKAIVQLVKNGVKPQDIGVISFYALQVDLIRYAQRLKVHLEFYNSSKFVQAQPEQPAPGGGCKLSGRLPRTGEGSHPPVHGSF